MDKGFIISVGVALLLVSLASLTSGQTQSQSLCQQAWLRSATACAQNASLNLNNLWYIASNGTEGSAPAEGASSFKARACVVRPQVDVCGQAVTQSLYNSTRCFTQVDRQTILSQSKALFGAFYDTCAQPCRYTLEKEIRQCYNYVNLSPTQLSDMALVRTAAIGENPDIIYQFCLNRDAVAQCIRQKALACPDSARVLSELGIQLGAFERGAEVLCRNQGVYRAGVHCLRNPIPEVRMCFQTMDTNMQQLMLIAPQPTADRNSLYRFCNIRLEHVECEQSAWARHQYKTCQRAVTGMRTEIECELIPKQCMNVFPNVYSRICSNMNYYYETRGRYNSAPSDQGFPWSLTALAVVQAVRQLIGHRL
ncbi:hypothetical protein RRG08_007856 [Elysia crispata]|uniref:Uncharacterized protein n=1 Tax=Elysia crispata TaxID=231223 RepID=A0AAE0XXM8_9GAST|nr:hypothetical protein RRG08_007856 [Elysia crispata]